MDAIDNKILMELQKGLPITARPYDAIAKKLGINIYDVLARVQGFKDSGIIRRIDFRIDLKNMGVRSTLVACQVPKDNIEEAKRIIDKCENVSHNYLRKHKYNMWFTLSAGSSERLEELINNIEKQLNIGKLLCFNTKKIFKLGFKLDAKQY